MKRIAALFFALCVFLFPLGADDFTEMIHALAVKVASLGSYDPYRSTSGNPGNYYTPQIWEERFAAEYGSISSYKSFEGVCFDFTDCTYNDIKANIRKYNSAGMHSNKFLIAVVDANPRLIKLFEPITGERAMIYVNGSPMKELDAKNIWAHDEWDNERAVNHAWIWIQRDDGVWFWVDPTWTDNVGWVVWGYIDNDREILLKPDEKFCVKWDPKYLDNRPDPPPRGPAIQPTYIAQDSPSSLPSSSSSYTSAYSSGYNLALSIGLSKPLNDFISGNYIGSSFWDIFGGVSLSVETGNARPTILLLQLDYYNLARKSLFLNFGYGRQFASIFGIYGGAGIGVAAESVSDFIYGERNFAWKAFAGARFVLGRLSLRADLSYVVDSENMGIFGGLVVPSIFVGWLF